MKPLANVGWVKTVVAGQSAAAAFPQSVAGAALGGGRRRRLHADAGASDELPGSLGIPGGRAGRAGGRLGRAVWGDQRESRRVPAGFLHRRSRRKPGRRVLADDAVATSNASEDAMCSSQPNDAAPGTEIVTCCSLAGALRQLRRARERARYSPRGREQQRPQRDHGDGDRGRGERRRRIYPILGRQSGPHRRAHQRADGTRASERYRPEHRAVGRRPNDLRRRHAAGHARFRRNGAELRRGVGRLTSDANDDGQWGTFRAHNIYVVFQGPPGDSLELIDLTFEAASPAGPRIQYRVGDVGQPRDNQIQPWLSVVNGGNTDITRQPGSSLLVHHRQRRPAGIERRLCALRGAERGGDVRAPDRAEAGRRSGAGRLVPHGRLLRSPRRLQRRYSSPRHKMEWSAYDETNDYSYDATKNVLRGQPIGDRLRERIARLGRGARGDSRRRDRLVGDAYFRVQYPGRRPWAAGRQRHQGSAQHREREHGQRAAPGAHDAILVHRRVRRRRAVLVRLRAYRQRQRSGRRS